MIIAFLNQKGGVGKTSASLGVASELARRGGRVLLIDADPQCSSLSWSTARGENPALFVVAGMPTESIHTQIKMAGQGYDHVVIDGPARKDEIAVSAAMCADVVIVPVTPSPLDIWAANDILKIIKYAQTFRPLRAAFLLNRKIAHTAIARDFTAALAGCEIPTLASQVTQRVIFAEATAGGRAVFEIDPSGPATREIEALTTEILEMSK